MLEKEKILKPEFNLNAATAQEELFYIYYLLNNLEFFKKNNYKVLLPENILKKFEQNKENWNNYDKQKIETDFRNNIYNEKYYTKELGDINDAQNEIKTMSERFLAYKKWFEILPIYEIILTRYGTGGSYIYYNNKAHIIIRVNEDRSMIDDSHPAGTIIHEFVHFGIEKNIVEKYKLTDQEKEAAVDKICLLVCPKIFNGYSQPGSKETEIFNIITEVNLSNLPEVIKNYKENHYQ